MSTTTRTTAFLRGYMHKEAAPLTWVPGAISRTTDTLLNKGTVFLVAAPVLLGLAGGYIASRVTSPADGDKVLQKRMVAHELDEALASIKRQRDLELAGAKPEKAKAPEDSRSLRLL